jgi:hypothetical protein
MGGASFRGKCQVIPNTPDGASPLTTGKWAEMSLNHRLTGGYPLGYYVPLEWAMLYAGLLGTHSFGLPIPGGRLPPSFAVLVRSGPYEIAAFIL